MSNHYHWVLQTPQANLVAGMKWFQNTYARRFNTRHKKWGHVFGGRYKAVLVEASGGGYLETLMDYVHLNPARAGLVDLPGGKDLLGFPWRCPASLQLWCAGQPETAWDGSCGGTGTFRLPGRRTRPKALRQEAAETRC